MPPATWLDEIKRVLEHVSASDATEVELAREGFRLRIKRQPGRRPPPRAAADTEVIAPAGVAVVAPLTGVFYRAPAAGAAPYVSEGDLVQPDTVVGLIETMKVFNEVAAERRGRVLRILVDSGQLVHAGDRLMLIEETGDEAAEQVTS